MSLMGFCSIFAAILFKKTAEETFSLIMFSTVLLMLPFYCLNLLKIGRCIYLCAMLVLALSACFYIKRNNGKIFLEFIKKITPGICIYAVLCGIFTVYLKGNIVSLWDELRLWGAVPKALHFSQQLQLGENAAIFGNMQSYQPGMPLLVYFLTSFCGNFCEYQIFATYAAVAFCVFLPALKNLKWSRWKYFSGGGYC